MDNYQNVDVDKLANIYFEGKVSVGTSFKKMVQKNIRSDIGRWI